jgi:hypothetical protein
VGTAVSLRASDVLDLDEATVLGSHAVLLGDTDGDYDGLVALAFGLWDRRQIQRNAYSYA